MAAVLAYNIVLVLSVTVLVLVIESEVYDNAEFIDQGENIEAVICLSCTKRSTLDHSTDDNPIVAWWYDLLESMEDADVTVQARQREVVKVVWA